MHLPLRVGCRPRLRRSLVVGRASGLGPVLLHQALDEGQRLLPVDVDALPARPELLQRRRLRHRAHRVGRVREVRIAAARDLVVAEPARQRVVADELGRGDVFARPQQRRLRRQAAVEERRQAHGRVVVAEAGAAAARLRHVEAAVRPLRGEHEARRLLHRLVDARHVDRRACGGAARRRSGAAGQGPEGQRRQGRHLRVAPMAVRRLLGQEERDAADDGRLEVRRGVRDSGRADGGEQEKHRFHAHSNDAARRPVHGETGFVRNQARPLSAALQLMAVMVAPGREARMSLSLGSSSIA